MTNKEINYRINKIYLDAVRDIDSLLLSEGAAVYKIKQDYFANPSELALDGADCLNMLSSMGSSAKREYEFFVRSAEDRKNDIIDRAERDVRQQEMVLRMCRIHLSDVEYELARSRNRLAALRAGEAAPSEENHGDAKWK